jgi:hypothetical protein
MPTTTLHIRRGGPGEAPRHDVFELSFEPGESVLDALRRLRIGTDPTLAFPRVSDSAHLLLDGDALGLHALDAAGPLDGRRRSRRVSRRHLLALDDCVQTRGVRPRE